jgi:hypothetical protein
MYCLFTLFRSTADCILEESQPDLPVFPAAKAHITLLLIHALLHHPPDDNVCA